MKETITFRPSKKESNKINKYLDSEQKRRKSPSTNNTLEQIVLEHKEHTDFQKEYRRMHKIK